MSATEQLDAYLSQSEIQSEADTETFQAPRQTRYLPYTQHISSTYPSSLTDSTYPYPLPHPQYHAKPRQYTNKSHPSNIRDQKKPQSLQTYQKYNFNNTRDGGYTSYSTFSRDSQFNQKQSNNYKRKWDNWTDRISKESKQFQNNRYRQSSAKYHGSPYSRRSCQGDESYRLNLQRNYEMANGVGLRRGGDITGGNALERLRMIREELKVGKLRSNLQSNEACVQKRESWDGANVEKMVKTVVNSLASSCINYSQKNQAQKPRVFEGDSDEESDEEDNSSGILKEFLDRPWMKYLKRNTSSNCTHDQSRLLRQPVLHCNSVEEQCKNSTEKNSKQYNQENVFASETDSPLSVKIRQFKERIKQSSLSKQEQHDENQKLQDENIIESSGQIKVKIWDGTNDKTVAPKQQQQQQQLQQQQHSICDARSIRTKYPELLKLLQNA